jgi:hypothetical protein
MKSQSPIDLSQVAASVATILSEREAAAAQLAREQTVMAEREASERTRRENATAIEKARLQRVADVQALQTIEREQSECHNLILSLVEQAKAIPGQILFAERRQGLLLGQISALKAKLGIN